MHPAATGETYLSIAAVVAVTVVLAWLQLAPRPEPDPLEGLYWHQRARAGEPIAPEILAWEKADALRSSPARYSHERWHSREQTDKGFAENERQDAEAMRLYQAAQPALEAYRRSLHAALGVEQ